MVLLQAILKAWNWSSLPCRQQQPTVGVTPPKGQLSFPPVRCQNPQTTAVPSAPQCWHWQGGQQHPPLPNEPHTAEIALQLHSASLVVSPNNSNPTATPFLPAMPRHYGQVSPTPSNCLFLMHFLNPFMVINRFLTQQINFKAAQ